MLKKFIFAGVVVSAFPVFAMATELTSVATLGYGESDVTDVSTDLSTTTLDLTSKLDVGNGFTLGFDASLARAEPDGIAADIDISALGVNGSYGLGNGVRFGAYVEKAKLGATGFNDSLSATSYGLTAGYSMGTADFEGFYGATDTDPSLPDSIDVRDYGVAVGVHISPELFVGGNLMRTQLSSGGMEANLDMIGVAASYRFAGAWTAFGGITNASISGEDTDINTTGLGVGYEMSNVFAAPVTFSAEVARSKVSVPGDSGRIDTVRFGLSVPIGGSRVIAPLNSVAGSVTNPRHNVDSSAALSAF